MARILFYILLLKISLTALAQQKVVMVIDGSTSAPIAWVSVRGENGYGTVTNLNGEFVLKDGYRGRLVLSSLGYETKTVDAHSIQQIVMLSPISYSIAETTIKGMSVDSLIRLLYLKYAGLMLNHTQENSTYLYRQTTANNGRVKELQESFFSADAGIRLQGLGLLYGRYADSDSGDDITHRNFHAFTSISPIGNAGEFGEVWTAPLCLNYADYYNVSLQVKTYNDRCLYILTFKERKMNSRPIIIGSLTVDGETLLPMKFEGQIKHFKYRNAITRNQSPTFSVSYYEKEGYAKVKSMSISDRYITRKAYPYKDDMMRTYNVKVDVEAIMYDVSESMPEKLIDAKVINGDDYLIESIKALPYDSVFWAENPIIKRTETESDAIRDFEIGGSFVNRQQIHADGGLSTRTSAEDVISKVNSFASLYPHEKVYLHFDNTGYFIGETIWYKAYVVQTASTHCKPTELSKVLYVELLTPGGDVIETQKLHIDEEGGAHGQFTIDSVLVSGFYEVRAYTRYMLNWGTNAVFSRVFPVFVKPERYGDYSKPTIKQTRYKDRHPNVRYSDSLYLAGVDEGLYSNDKPKTLNAHFYPEGGDLVAGLKSRVAMLVTDDNGSTYKGKGKIMNESGKVFCEVGTDSTGRTLFDLVPTGEKLFLSMTNPKKKVQKMELPAVKSEGTTMHLDVVSEDISVTLHSQGEILGKGIGYALMHNGSIFACDTMTAAPTIELSLIRSTMPEGVNQITVFDSAGRILAERLFFICPKPDKADSITVTPVSKGLGPVSEVELNLHTYPNSTFSFSAMDYGAMTRGKQGNAKTWMLMSSDVKGYIADIDYYFEADDEQHRKDADLLMMIQGWRRYDWNLMSGMKKFEKMHPIEDRLLVYGQLYDSNKKTHIDNVEIDAFLYNQSGQSLRGTAFTDSLGRYSMNMPDVSGEWEMQLLTKTSGKRKSYNITIDRQFSPAPKFIEPTETEFTPRTLTNFFTGGQTENDNNDLTFADKVHVIPEVTINARKYWTSSDNILWYDENAGRREATVYYDIRQELDRILDKGNPVPTVFEFLTIHNPLFGNRDCANLPNLDKTYNLPIVLSNDTLFRPAQQWGGGMSYGGRKIKWIIDNGLGIAKSDRSNFLFMDSASVHLKTVYEKQPDLFTDMIQKPAYSFGRLSLSAIDLISGKNHFSDIADFPVNMEDIKSIYIVPESRNDEEDCVTIYIYRNHIFTTESQKGLRRTHYHGYNIPETFRMEDLNVLPPLENLRRTIYWDPDVRTDENGNATIKFYNNLSATELYISAEGITKEGRIVVNE